MGQRNRTVDLEMEQHQQSRTSLQREPCILLNSFPQQQQQQQPPMMVSNIPNLESHSLQDPTYDNSAMFYGLPQYHHHQQQHQPAPTNFYVPYVAYQPPPSQLPSSSIHGSDHFMDHTRGAYKRKNAEGLNPQYLAAPFHIPETVSPYGAVTMNQVRPPHCQNSFVQGTYAGHHPFPPPGSIWYDQHHGRPDGSPSFWPHTPYMHGGTNNNVVSGSIESSSRNPTSFMYPSQLNPRDHYYSHHHHHNHPAIPPVQGVRGQSSTLYPHVASSASYRVPPSSYPLQNAMNSGPSGAEMGSVQQTGFRIYQQHQRDDSLPVATLRQHRGLPRLRVMPDDEVAILEFGDFLGTNHVDHHRDMRLDIEEMSYEELLALSERIGTVNTGLPEEEVKNHLKTRTCFGNKPEKESSSSSSPQAKDIESEPCTICQESFKNEEKIATLDCGHEYHAECLEKWLIVKNVCPICKSEALVMEKRKV
ncbi:unnamed protein product [Cochlearia groenlandica]